MSKKKTLEQEAAESLRRRAGQHQRHGRHGLADLLRDAAKKLLGQETDKQYNVWDDLTNKIEKGKK